MDSVAFLGQVISFSVDASSSDVESEVEARWFVDHVPATSGDLSHEVDTSDLGAGVHSIEVELAVEPAAEPLTLLWRVDVLDAEDEGGVSAFAARSAPPVIESTTPCGDVTAGANTTLGFAVAVGDSNAGDTLDYKWFVDGHEFPAAASAHSGSRFEFPAVNYRPGFYEVSLRVFDDHQVALDDVVGGAEPIAVQEVQSESEPGGILAPGASQSWVVRVLDSKSSEGRPGRLRAVAPLASLRIRTGSPLPFTVVTGEEGDVGSSLVWSLDGVRVPGANSSTFLYQPSIGQEGRHAISVTASGGREGAERGSCLESDPLGYTWIVDVLSASDDDEPSLQLKPSSFAIVVDDRFQNNGFTGDWERSHGFGAYGPGSVFAKARASFDFDVVTPIDEDYDVFLWWSRFSSRAVAAPVAIQHAKGTDEVIVNQLTGGGQWNYIGTYSFVERAIVSLRGDGSLPLSADAVCLSPSRSDASRERDNLLHAIEAGVVTIVDDGDAQARTTGTWKSSRAHDPYGDGSQYCDGRGSYTIEPQLTDGRYRVFLWWTSFRGRSGAVPVVIKTTFGEARIDVDQRTNGGAWNLVGTFDLDDTSIVQLLAERAGTVCADAVKFERLDALGIDASRARLGRPPKAPEGLSATAKDSAVLVDWQDSRELDLGRYGRLPLGERRNRSDARHDDGESLSRYGCGERCCLFVWSESDRHDRTKVGVRV